MKRMETRTYTADFEVGQAVKVYCPDYECHTGHPHPLEGKTGKVLAVIFPGDTLYEFAGDGIPNGTGAIKYTVQLDVPTKWSDKYLLSGRDLIKI